VRGNLKEMRLEASKVLAEIGCPDRRGRKQAGIKKPMPAWVIHDLRRSVTIHLVESRQRRRTGDTYSFAQPHVAEAITNHISGHKSGVAGRYNKAAYLPERRQALEKWSSHIVGLVQDTRVKTGPRKKARVSSAATPVPS
jgi:hypothetical protein